MAKTTGGHRIEDHFADVSKMVETKQRKRLGTTEGKKRGQIYFTNSSKLRIIGDSRYVRPRQGRVIQRVCIPPRKQGHPPGSKSLEAV